MFIYFNDTFYYWLKFKLNSISGLRFSCSINI